MNKFRFTVKIMAIAIFTFAFASMAQAQATRTWVSGVGDDANPCSRTAPCKTFAGAISKTAAGGEIDALDPGGFGAVTITKSITIDACCMAGILAAGTNGVIVNDSGANSIIVTLRHISINGATTGVNGVRFISGKTLNIESCQIFGFLTSGVNQGAGIDVQLTANGATLNVKETSIFNNTRGIRNTTSTGISFATVDHSHIQNNTANGIVLEANGWVVLRDTIVSTSPTGINSTGGGNSNATLINCTVINCAVGLNANNNTARLANSTFFGNTAADLSQSAPNTIKTAGDNNINGTILGGALQLVPPQ